MRKKQQPSNHRFPTKNKAVVFLMGAIVLAGGIAFLFPSGSTENSVTGVSEIDPRVLPATPRVPRPKTLPPERFTGTVRRAYEVAQKYPELLERMPCYCGCYTDNGHQNNLDCYVDRHAVG